ncbi:MAG: TonB-dependent receptor [Bacteroidota bacterium]
MYNHFYLVIWILFLISFRTLHAQSVSGRIIDQLTKKSIEGVQIGILGTHLAAMSDSSGQFTIVLSKAGTYQLHCSHPSYESMTRGFLLGMDVPTSIGLVLSPLPYQLPQEIITSARRSEENLWNIPEMMAIMDQAEISERSPRTTPELMMSMPGVWMQKTNHGGGSAILRGLTGNQTLLMVDGIRINNSTYRYGPNQYLNTIDPWTVEKIEVIRGGGAVQYGSDALGGVIQLLTVKPQFSEDKFQSSVSAQGKFMSADMEKNLRANWQLKSQKVFVNMGFSYKDFGDLLAGGELGVQAPSAYTEIDGDFKAVIRLSQKDQLSLHWQRVDQRNVSRFDQVAQRGYGLYEFNPQQRNLAYARWEHQDNSPWLRQLRLTCLGQTSNEVRAKQKQDSPILRTEQDEVSTIGAVLEHQATPINRWTIISGLDIYSDQIASIAQELNTTDSSQVELRGLYPDGASALNASIFSLHSLEFNGITLKAGLRHSLIRLSAFDLQFGGFDLRPQATVGHIAASYHLGKWHHLSSSFQTGFRSPNINDLSSFGSFDSGIEVPAQELGAERSATGELVYKFSHPQLSGSIGMYYSHLKGLIERVPTTFNGSDRYLGEAVFAKANVAAAFIRGIEMDARFALLPELELYTHGTYTFGATQEDPSSPLRRIPPLYGGTGLSWKSDNGFTARLEYRYASRQNRLSDGDIRDHRIPDGGTPGWQVLDAFWGYQWKKFQGRVGLQNLFDQAYRLHGSGVDAYGRSIWVAIQLTI